jgi:hypothetical protein
MASSPPLWWIAWSACSMTNAGMTALLIPSLDELTLYQESHRREYSRANLVPQAAAGIWLIHAARTTARRRNTILQKGLV